MDRCRRAHLRRGQTQCTASPGIEEGWRSFINRPQASCKAGAGQVQADHLAHQRSVSHRRPIRQHRRPLRHVACRGRDRVHAPPRRPACRATSSSSSSTSRRRSTSSIIGMPVVPRVERTLTTPSSLIPNARTSPSAPPTLDASVPWMTLHRPTRSASARSAKSIASKETESTMRRPPIVLSRAIAGHD